MKSIIKIVLSCFVLYIFASCEQEDNRVYEENSNSRIEDKKEHNILSKKTIDADSGAIRLCAGGA